MSKRGRSGIPSGTAFDNYLSEVIGKFNSGKATEHTYRPALQELLESLLPEAKAINEPRRVRCGAPDFIVQNSAAPIGYIEAKDIGVDLDEAEEDEQLVRYRTSLSNLILTDYLEFRWYVNGEKRLTVRIGEVLKGKIHFRPDFSKDLSVLINAFQNADVPTLKDPAELAMRLAAITQSVKFLIVETLHYENEKGWLHKWLKAFSEILITGLNAETFADMFAQTLTYGFFAARVHHMDQRTEFSRFAAAKILPRTNPFLRQLFAEFAGINMPDELSWAVDEIVELLKRTDIKEVLENFGNQFGKNDPVVHFYETFLAHYNPALREKRGVYYTPEPVVDFIARSVDDILKMKFSKRDGLADDSTLILDPAVGTGSFLHKVVDLIKKRVERDEGAWDSYVADTLLERLFGFEILMAPYAVAHLKLGMQLQDSGYKFQRNQRLGVYLTNTLEDAAKKSQEMLFDWVSDEANAASDVKRKKPIMVVIGNPPYSGESANNGDWINGLLRGYDSITEQATGNYFVCEGKPLGDETTKWLNDDYVKFIRFAQWRIEQTGHGVLAFITNHGFLDNFTFRGMRENLMSTFDEIYVLDVHGSSKKKEAAPNGQKDENVFDIQQGVSISFFVRRHAPARSKGKVFRADLWGTRAEKYAWLKGTRFTGVDWKELSPSAPLFEFAHVDKDLNEEYEPHWALDEIFPINGVGMTTARDHVAISFDRDALNERAAIFTNIRKTDAQVCAELEISEKKGWNCTEARRELRAVGAVEDLIKPVTYRPFDSRHILYHESLVWRTARKVMGNMLGGNNLAIIATKQTKDKWGISVTKNPIAHKAYSAYDISSLFPLYIDLSDELGDEDSTVNIDAKFIKHCEQAVGLRYDEGRRRNVIGGNVFGPEDLFSYIVASLNASNYAERYEQMLRKNFPKIQVTTDRALFWKFVESGRAFINAFNAEIEISDEVRFPIKGTGKVEFVKYNEKLKRVEINDAQYFTGVSKEVWNEKFGGFIPAKRYLEDRKDRKLSFSELRSYMCLITAIESIFSIRESLDKVVSKAGQFPIKSLHRKVEMMQDTSNKNKKKERQLVLVPKIVERSKNVVSKPKRRA